METGLRARYGLGCAVKFTKVDIPTTVGVREKARVTIEMEVLECSVEPVLYIEYTSGPSPMMILEYIDWPMPGAVDTIMPGDHRIVNYGKVVPPGTRITFPAYITFLSGGLHIITIKAGYRA
ncbi:MAG: hypothetical protein DRO39_06855 [Thermoprotei archaeon]|nr:MAG: hypothetical protein DRO39_06855 [Thermoprotei archaeon]